MPEFMASNVQNPPSVLSTLRRPGSTSALPDRFDLEKLAQFRVRGDELCAKYDRGGDDDPVGRVGRDEFGKFACELRNVRADRLDAQFCNPVQFGEPFGNRQPQVQPAAAYSSSDLEQADCRRGDGAEAPGTGHFAPRACRQPGGTRHPPEEGMGVENDHRLMSHSFGSMTGSVGRSKRRTVPRSRFHADADSDFAGSGGANSATTLPREVMRTRSPRLTLAR